MDDVLHAEIRRQAGRLERRAVETASEDDMKAGMMLRLLLAIWNEEADAESVGARQTTH
jgi:hypothetical protein